MTFTFVPMRNIYHPNFLKHRDLCGLFIQTAAVEYISSIIQYIVQMHEVALQ